MKSVLRRYHWVVIGLTIIVLLVVASEMVEGLGALLPTTEGTGFNQADSEKIKLGMTEKEVIEALGSHPGNYATGEFGVGKLPRNHGPGSIQKLWASDSGVIFVHFDEEGKVTYVLFQKPTVFREPFFQRLLRKLGLK